MLKFLITGTIILLISFNSSAQSVFNDRNYAIINKQGQIVHQLEAKYIHPFSNERARISLYAVHDKKATFNEGFIDLNGRLVIPAIYEEARDFEDGIPVTWAKVKGEQLFRIIDKQGNRVGDISADYVGKWKEGLCQVGIKDPNQKMPNGQFGFKYGFVNTQGEWIIHPDADLIGAAHYSNGIIALEKRNASTGFGFFNHQGDTVLPMKYVLNGAPYFHQNIACLSAGGNSYFINIQGDTLFKVPYTNIIGYNDSIILVAFGKQYDKFGYIHYNGDILLPGKYSRAALFHHNFAVVYTDNTHGGIINLNGKEIIPLQYEQVINHADKGFFTALKAKNWHYFDTAGNAITAHQALALQYKDTDAYPIYDSTSGKWQLINANGFPITETKYCQAYPMTTSGHTIVELCK